MSGNQGDVRASFDVAVTKSLVPQRDHTKDEARLVEMLNKMYGDERIYLKEKSRFIGAKAPVENAARVLNVKVGEVQDELIKPFNPKIAALSNEELAIAIMGGTWNHGASVESFESIDKDGFIVPQKALSTVVPACCLWRLISPTPPTTEMLWVSTNSTLIVCSTVTPQLRTVTAG